MTPAKLKCFQDRFKEMEENKSDFFNSILPNQLTLKQHNLLKTFVTERIQNERATATRS